MANRKQTCDHCGGHAGFMTSPEGQNCRVCGDWVCDDCCDLKKSGENGYICKKCSEKEEKED